jgi:hypothetical protein
MPDPPTLPTLPKTLVKGENAGVCKTTSAEYDVSKARVIYLIPEYEPVWRGADLILESA